MLRSVILGCGSYLPKQRVTNHDLAKKVETSHDWIVERTGIEARHIAADGELTSDLAYEAAKQAIERAGVSASSIDLVILATVTPDDTMPATAARVQHRLGIPPCMAFDMQAACSGFLYSMTLADTMLRTGQAKRALVIGAETFSRVVDWSDRNTCILFGDGAGAVVMEAQEGERGVLGAKLYADGGYGDLLMTTGGVSRNGISGVLLMQGKEVFRHAAIKMADSLQELLKEQGLTTKDIQWLVPHQANLRILKATAERLEVDESRLILTVAGHANTSAASIPLALAEGSKQFKKNDLIGMVALGSGLTWGAGLIRW